MTRWWTLCFALICPLELAVRTAIESDDEPQVANVTGTCPVLCRGVPSHTDGRINQGRYVLQAEDARKVTWKVQDGTKFTIHSSSECLDKDLIMAAEVVPWVDRDDPINGSTMEIFVDPAVALKKLRRQSAAYVCADGVADRRECFCEVETSGEQRYYGILNFLTQPLHGFSSVVEVLLAVDRRCPATWIPDALIMFLLLLLGSLLVFCIEAALAARKEREHEDLTQADGPGKDVAVVAAPLSSLKTGLTSAMGFVTTILTMQTFAVAKIVKDDTPERLVWFLIGLAFVLSAVGAYRIFQVVSKVQLLQASLARNLCIYGTPRSSWLDAALFVGVLLYAALVTLVVELFASAWSIAAVIGAAVLVISAMVGPIMSLFKVLQTTSQTEMDGKQLKMEPERLAELRKGSASASIQVEGWTFVGWKDLVKAGREGEESALSSSSSDLELSAEAEEGELKVLDALWQRRTVKRMTGSYAGFLVLPCLAFTLLVAVSAAAMHVLIYSCSSGELKALNMAGVEDAMTFKASQDRYAVMLDSSFQQVVLEAVGTEYLARKIRVHPGKMTKSSAQSPNSANALVELHSLKIPRVVDVEVKGLCPSLNSTKYSIRFAPNQLLPQKLLIASEDNTFQRCIAFSTLAGSRLSIPSNVSKVKVLVFFTDYAVGVPLEHGRTLPGVESTWTAFAAHNKSSCMERCHASPHCLHAFEGHAGCFFAQHDYNLHTDRCDLFSSVNISSVNISSTFKAELQGCNASNSSGSTCGSAEVEQYLADFGLIEPSWRGEAVADLDFSLGMEASWQNLPLLSQAVVLRRGRPQVADVLVNITGHTQQNGTADIPASGKLLENGNIVLVVSKYDMTEMKSLQMIIVPILPDENFKVRWLNEKAENMDIPAEDLPIFKHCLESEVLLQRYRACKNAGGTGDWNTSILNRTIAPDFQGVEIHFVVELHSASPSDSYLGWGKRRSHRITAEFVGVDAPLAWAAKQHGCHLLDNERALLRSTLHTNEAHSADGLCEILHCNKSTNASQPTPLCAGYHDRYGPLRLNEAFQSTSNVMKLMSCIDKFCDARLEETSVGWTYHHGSLTTTHPGWDDVNQKEYQKTWRLADLFEAALDLDNDLFANALDVLSGIARHAANETYLADNKTRDGKQQSLATDWLRHAIETRSLPLLQAVSSALPQGFLNTEEFVGETVCKTAWKVADQHSENASWSINWLTGVAQAGMEVSENWTKCLVEAGFRAAAEPEVMERFLEHVGDSLSNASSLSLAGRNAGALDNMAKALKYPSKLKGLGLYCDGPSCNWRPEFVEAFAHVEDWLSLSGWNLGQAELNSLAAALPRIDSGSVLGRLWLYRPPMSAKLFRPLTSLCVEELEFQMVLRTAEDAMSVASDIRNASMPCLKKFCTKCEAGCKAIEEAVNATNATYENGYC